MGSGNYREHDHNTRRDKSAPLPVLPASLANKRSQHHAQMWRLQSGQKLGSDHFRAPVALNGCWINAETLRCRPLQMQVRFRSSQKSLQSFAGSRCCCHCHPPNFSVSVPSLILPDTNFDLYASLTSAEFHEKKSRMSHFESQILYKACTIMNKG